nr:hypothetical protein GCM10025730_30140 [Promicromonospora thailandica]
MVAAPVIERAPVEDQAVLDAARERLAAGAYAWVAVTSVNAVDALLGASARPAAPAAGGPLEETVSRGRVAQSRQRLLSATHARAGDSPRGDTPGTIDTPNTSSAHEVAGARETARDTTGAHSAVGARSVRWAAVGPATEQALAAHGISAELVPGTATGAGLADAFPAAPRRPDAGPTGQRRSGSPAPEDAGRPRVLLPLGDLAADTVRAGLVAKGWAVDVVTAYRTVARELPAAVRRRRYDVVVVASGSAARRLAAEVGPQRVVAIGEPSARAAGDVGHTVLGVAASPTDEALADAVTEAIVRA